MDCIVDIQINEPFLDMADKDWLSHVIQTTLLANESPFSAEVSLLVTDDEVVHSLNRDYRGIDETTDVLAFALHADEKNCAFPNPDGGKIQLGEVIISAPQAARQAAENNQPLDQELTRLTIHGVLHLLGHDHQDQKQEREMNSRLDGIVAKLK